MRYDDIADDVSSRFDLPASHPILARIEIDPADWFKVVQLVDENPATKLLGHDQPHDERMAVFIACASRKTCDRLKDGWE